MCWLHAAFGPASLRATSQPPPQSDASADESLSFNEKSDSGKSYDIKSINSSVTVRPYYSMPPEPSRLLSGTLLVPAPHQPRPLTCVVVIY